MLYKKISQAFSPIINLSIWSALFYANVGIFVAIPKAHSMDRPPHLDEGSSQPRKKRSAEQVESRGEKISFARLLQNHSEAEKLRAAFENVEISSKPSKRRNAEVEERGDTEGSVTTKKAHGKGKFDDYVIEKVREIIPEDRQKAVLQFLTLPRIIQSLIDVSPAGPNPQIFWKPILEAEAPHLLPYLGSKREEPDLPPDVWTELNKLLDKYVFPYNEWETQEATKEFLPIFLTALCNIPHAAILAPALKLAGYWYMSQNAASLNILLLLGYPCFTPQDGQAAYTFGTEKLKPQTAELIFHIIEYTEKKNAWPNDTMTSTFLQSVAEISLTSLCLAVDLFLDKLILLHKDDGYRSYFDSFWDNLAQLDKIHTSETIERILRHAAKEQSFQESLVNMCKHPQDGVILEDKIAQAMIL